MSREVTNLKVRLPVNLVKQIQGVSNEPIEKIIQNSISHYIATYASEIVIAETVTQYIVSTEKLFGENFDKLTNLIANLSYVSKFNINILNAIFLNNGGKEEDLERIYNDSTETVRKYFYFEDNDSEVLPIIEENDQLRLKVQTLEKEDKKPKNHPQANSGVADTTSTKQVQEQVMEIQKQKERLEEQKKELVKWINGLILHVVQNYSHFRKNEKLLREYINENPKPQV